MIKSGLMRRIKEQNQHLHMTDVDKLVDAILDEIEAALVRRDRVELRGFGAFFLKTRPARPGRNPKNGAMVSVPERLHPAFKTGKEMHRRLNGTQAAICAQRSTKGVTPPNRLIRRRKRATARRQRF
jgi:integration host factor subunit beta